MKTLAAIIFGIFGLGGCSALRSDPFAYRITAVKTLSGRESHVSDADTFLVTARGAHSIIHAEGYSYIEVGTDICRVGALAFPKNNSAKPCAGNIDMGNTHQFHITSETEGR